MKKFGKWSVSVKGDIKFEKGKYVISNTRLLEDWEKHLKEKNWAIPEISDFMSAYIHAISLVLHDLYRKAVNKNLSTIKYASCLEKLKKHRQKLANIYQEKFGYLVKIKNNRGFPVLFRENMKEETLPCLFCGSEHIHGSGEGHRITHCIKSGKGLEQILEIESEKYDMGDGYIIVHF